MNPSEQERPHLGPEGHRSRLKARFDRSGLSGLAEHEILELLLTYVIPRGDTKPQAKRLLMECGDLPGVFAATPERLTRLRGVGPESARFLRFIREVAQHALRHRVYGNNAIIHSASDLVAYLGGSMANLPDEQFRVVFLDHGNKVIRDETIATGVEEQTAVYPRKVIRRALELHATGLVVVHNHPTGRVSPSPADRDMTLTLQRAAEALDLRLLDHLIIGREGPGYFSFRENGLLS